MKIQINFMADRPAVESDIRNADKDLFKCHKNVNISHKQQPTRRTGNSEWKINEMFSSVS